MPDDDRSETGYSAMPSTVRSDDPPSSAPASAASVRRSSPDSRPPTPARLWRLVLLLFVVVDRVRPLGPAVARRLARPAAALARPAAALARPAAALARPAAALARRLAWPAAAVARVGRPGVARAGRLVGVAAARLRVAAAPALALLHAQWRRLRRTVEPGLVRVRRVPAVRTAERAVRRAAERAAPPARRLLSRAGALAARTGLPQRLGLRRPDRRVRVALAAGLLCCLGVLAAVEVISASADPTDSSTAHADDRVALSRPDDGSGGRPDDGSGGRAPDRSSRSGDHGRSDGARSDEADPDTSSPLDDAEPVAGLTPVQMDNARAIVRTGRDMGVSRRGLIIGVATAMQESNLLNRASEVLPESKRYRHQGTGWDHDSVGLFQQRTSSGWGPVHRLMDPAYASARFFEALRQVPGWQRMRLTEAAQAVQYSAYPEHYAKHEGQAARVVDALVPDWR
ncbi:hypothetical protein ABNF97_32095 [Plantactinospora sp. B6F1]|uniref:hypothetical protein n=1 Tax=Plantactinospora sp. B6F1 TaxID=3158971 RepID=UPI0032D95F04